MTTAHTAILMQMDDNKVLIMTVVDNKTINLNVPIGLIAVNTTNSIWTRSCRNFKITNLDNKKYRGLFE